MDLNMVGESPEEGMSQSGCSLNGTSGYPFGSCRYTGNAAMMTDYRGMSKLDVVPTKEEVVVFG
jgi:hypothetical protein